ncbi:MAG: HAD family hydrolase [Planctomycetota bacterium]
MSHPSAIKKLILEHSRPMEPQPTSVDCILQSLTGIRVVLFDIYGTLLISGCGDIGTGESDDDHFVNALNQAGLQVSANNDLSGPKMIHDEILADHQESRLGGIDYPEVDMIEIWKRVIDQLVQSGAVQRLREGSIDYERVAAFYELQNNPAWPMPDAVQSLQRLSTAGKTLGIISNAQLFTTQLWPTLLDEAHSTFQMDPALRFYSYQTKHAKPGQKMFELAANELAGRGVDSSEVIYLGNDMLNDMMPAQQVGFKTALFAGDARSLRLRKDDPRVASVSPDLVVNRLSDFCDVVIDG